jgi:translation elongation factor EF-Ts
MDDTMAETVIILKDYIFVLDTDKQVTTFVERNSTIVESHSYSIG